MIHGIEIQLDIHQGDRGGTHQRQNVIGQGQHEPSFIEQKKSPSHFCDGLETFDCLFCYSRRIRPVSLALSSELDAFVRFDKLLSIGRESSNDLLAGRVISIVSLSRNRRFQAS